MTSSFFKHRNNATLKFILEEYWKLFASQKICGSKYSASSFVCFILTQQIYLHHTYKTCSKFIILVNSGERDTDENVLFDSNSALRYIYTCTVSEIIFVWSALQARSIGLEGGGLGEGVSGPTENFKYKGVAPSPFFETTRKIEVKNKKMNSEVEVIDAPPCTARYKSNILYYCWFKIRYRN